MTPGQRVVWLVPGKVGRVEAYHAEPGTVDLTFEDGSTRGGVPVTEVISVTDTGQPALPTVSPGPTSSAIPSQERFGRPSLG